MAKFNDSQILELLITRIKELYSFIPDDYKSSHDTELFYSGYLYSLDSLSKALSFYQTYEFD